eukprot:4345320-Amphidinium_carterae.1
MCVDFQGLPVNLVPKTHKWGKRANVDTVTGHDGTCAGDFGGGCGYAAAPCGCAPSAYGCSAGGCMPNVGCAAPGYAPQVEACHFLEAELHYRLQLITATLTSLILVYMCGAWSYHK